MMESQRPSELLRMLETLKKLLRNGGLRHGDIAAELGVAERTVTRYLAGRGLTMAMFEKLCALVGLSLTELANLTRAESDPRPGQLTVSQEEALSADLFSAFLFRMLRYGWTPAEIRDEFDLEESALADYLAFLERLRLIDLLPGNCVRLRTRSTLQWNPGGPMRQAFDRVIKQGFVDMDYRSPSALWDVKTIKLAPEAKSRLKLLIREYSDAVMQLADEFRPAAGDDGEWLAILLAIRAVDPRNLRGHAPRL